MKLLNTVTIISSITFFFSCNDDITESKGIEEVSQPGKIVMKIDLSQAQTVITMINGFLTRTNFDTVFFQFEIKGDTATATVENIYIGEWNLQVNAYSAEGTIAYSGSRIVYIVPGIITPISLQLSPTTGGLEINVTWGAENIYFEGFEYSMEFGSYQLVNGNSYIKEGRDGWKAYAEAYYDSQDVSTSWDWVIQENPQNATKWIRGMTTVNEMGILWLFKSIPVKENEQLVVTVQARTKKIHNGSDTGPSLYVFDGIVEYPSTDLNNILGWDNFTWGSFTWSPWQDLKVTCYPSQDTITVGLKVGDGWKRYLIYHEFDSLNLYYPN